MEAGALPNLAALIGRGARAVLTSTIPTHSWSAWPSFLTGVDPVDHGVFDILENRRGSSQKPVSFTSIRERTFLHDLTQAGVETLSINVPLTSPPPAISGKLIGGGVLPTGRPFTHPTSLADDLEKAGVPFPINGMSWTTYRHKPVPFLEEALQVTRARQRATEHLLDTTDWRVAVAVFVAPDRVQHCLNEYVSPDHPDYARRSKEPLAEKVRDVYRLLDEGIGRLVERTGPEDLVVFMSDHGMRACTGTVNVDRLLEHVDLLKFSASNAVFGPMQWGPVRTIARKVYDALGLHGKVSLPQAVNWSKTQAYTSIRSTGEGVNVNLAGREAQRDRRSRRLRARARRGVEAPHRLPRSAHGRGAGRVGGPPRGGAEGQVRGGGSGPAARAAGPVHAHARPPRGRAGRLELGRPPHRGRARGGRAVASTPPRSPTRCI